MATRVVAPVTEVVHETAVKLLPAVIAGPFGLLGFAIATLLLNLANVGAYPLNSMVLACGIALGLGIQLVGSLIAYHRGEFSGAFLFGAYSLFWLSFVLMVLLPHLPPSPAAIAWYLFLWGLFTLAMTVAIWKPKSTWALRFVFIFLTLLFFLLAVSDWILSNGDLSNSSGLRVVAGIVGLVTGFLAFYTAIAEALNFIYASTILPLGEVLPEPSPASAFPAQVIAGPFGLLGFGMATILLNLANLGVFPVNTMILGMGFALGFLMQLYGAFVAYQRGEFTAAFAFGAYAFFWLSYFLIHVFPLRTNATALGFYLLIWGLFTFAMTIAVWKPRTTWALRILFLLLTMLFFLLAFADWTFAAGNDPSVLRSLAGIIGLLTGGLAFYMAIAEVLNFVYATTLLPLGEVLPEPSPLSEQPLLHGRVGTYQSA